MENGNSTSLYDFISAAVVDGRLPKDFSLPKLAADDSQIAWMDGAWDGVTIYHMGFSEISDDGFSLMAKAVRAASDKDFDRADELFCMLGRDCRAISTIDVIQSYVIEHKDKLSARNIYDYGIHAVLDSNDRECVKYGLSLLELFDTDSDEILKNVIRTLGLSDEFSIFAVFVMLRWEDGNNEIYQLARKIYGWGRIHAVERIEPKTEEIKKWLLLEGVHNAVLPAYSALVCWQKSGAEDILRNNPSREEFSGIRDIIEGLLDEGPVRGISEIENREEVMAAFLSLAETMDLDLDDYEAIHAIRIYFESGKPADSEIVSRCRKILLSDNCKALVTEAVKEGRAISLAQDLELDYKDDILALLKSSFDQKYYLCNLLMPDPKYKDEVLALFLQNVSFDEIKARPTKSPGLGQDFVKHRYLESILQEIKRYPLEGQEFVEAALQSSPVRTRNMGIGVLEAWISEKGTPLKNLLPGMYSLICRLREIEPEDGVKASMDKLIEGKEVECGINPS